MIQLNIDCEGPLTQNDNAFELCKEYIPEGGKFFSLISKYDDFLADVVQKPGYKAGDTLKLVLPFLKAFDVTDEIMEKFSEKTLVLLSGTEIMLPKLNAMFPSFIISTSYKPYLEALSNLTSFPIENCFCTEVKLDKYLLTDEEKEVLKKLSKEIASMDMIDWEESAKGIDDLKKRDRETVRELDRIFWEVIPSMSIGKIFDEVNPIGGVEKANAILESLKRTGFSKKDVIYAGDSITDCQALELVRTSGGVAISFNGNRYAIREAQYAVLSENTCVIAALCCLFKKDGNKALEKFDRDETGRLDIEKLMKAFEAVTPLEIISQLETLISQKGVLEIYKIEEAQREMLIKKSEKIRKEVRGHRVGNLG